MEVKRIASSIPYGKSADRCRDELDRILQERDELFPERDPQNTEAMEQGMRAYMEALQTNLDGWSPQRGLVQRTEEFLGSPIFVCGPMKSGTTMLVELFDGNQELVVMPADSHELRVDDKFQNLRKRDLVERWTLYWIHRLVNPKGQAPFWPLGDNAAYRDLAGYLGYFGRKEMTQTTPFLGAVSVFYCANLTVLKAPDSGFPRLHSTSS